MGLNVYMITSVQMEIEIRKTRYFAFISIKRVIPCLREKSVYLLELTGERTKIGNMFFRKTL